MTEKLDPKELVTLMELAVSSMWEVAPIVEALKRIRAFSVSLTMVAGILVARAGPRE